MQRKKNSNLGRETLIIKMKQETLDIIVPCYNPPDNWEIHLVEHYHKLKETLHAHRLNLILVNDGSTKNFDTAKVNSLQTAIPEIQIINMPSNKGKGAALRKGIGPAQGHYQIFTDVDFPYTIDSILKVFQALTSGSNVALGYREPSYYMKVPLFRKVLSKILRWTLKSIFKLPITDTQCGLKGFDKKGKELFSLTTIDRFLFDLEYVKLISNNKAIAVTPVIVELREGVQFSRVNIKVLLMEMANFIIIALKR